MSDVSRPKDYEKADADARLVGILAFGVAVFLAITPFFLKALYPDATGLGGIPSTLPQPPAPRLQVEPKADLEALHAAERKQLTAYGWLNRERQVAHVPIQRAMELVGERGLPGWPQPPNAPPRPAAR